MPFRLAVSADLHYDVPRSRAPAELLAQQVNAADVDGVLLVGDTATADGDGLERCLRLFREDRPRWFVPGNHELWTKREPRDVRHLLADELPRRIAAAGWHWLPGAPARIGNAALVGSLGWYDYSFAEPRLALPRRFYAAKLSPGAARALRRRVLEPDAEDVPPTTRDFVARWNDGRFIQGIVDDAAFLRERLVELATDLAAIDDADEVLAAVHVAPVAHMLPQVPTAGPVPPERYPLAFTRAYLGSPAIGEVIGRHANVRHVVCGHTHVARRQHLAGREWINVGSTYVEKRFVVVELPGEVAHPSSGAKHR